MEKAAIAATALTPCLILIALLIRKLRIFKPSVQNNQIAFFIVFSLLSIVFVGLWTWVVEHWKLQFTGQLAYGFYESFLLAAIPEELSRYLILRWRLTRLEKPINLKLCWWLGCLVGLVFGTLEHVIYSVNEGWHSCWQRLLVNVPYHTFAGAVIGWFIGLALLKRNELRGLVGVAIMIGLHGVNNFNLRRLFETIEEPGYAVEHTSGWLESILVTHWPSNILVTLTTTVLALCLYHRSEKSGSTTNSMDEPN